VCVETPGGGVSFLFRSWEEKRRGGTRGGRGEGGGGTSLFGGRPPETALEISFFFVQKGRKRIHALVKGKGRREGPYNCLGKGD